MSDKTYYYMCTCTLQTHTHTSDVLCTDTDNTSHLSEPQYQSFTGN